MSRRSKSIALVAALSSSAFMLSACSEPPPPQDVASGDAANADALKTCIANPSNTVDKCEQYFGPNAKQVSYSNANACNSAGMGACQVQQASDGSNVYVPLMLGYMLGNMNSGGGGTVVRHVYHYTPPPPTYYQSRSTYYGSSPRTSFNSAPSYTSSHYSSPSYSSSVRSGGFGGSAAAHGGCCS